MTPGTREMQTVVELLLPTDLDLEKAKRIAMDAATLSPFVFLAKPVEIQVEEEFRGSRS